MKLLLHSCCAHCAAYTIEHWRREGHEVAAFWYNPNIHPFTEHQQRLEAVKALVEQQGASLLVQEGYDIYDYFRRVAGHEEERCRFCFELRLDKTAEVARERGFAGFTTTLLISPHQKHELIHECGDGAAAKRGVQFFYADLRKRYSDSRHITKPLGLYRQQYCGCLYSEWERFRAVPAP